MKSALTMNGLNPFALSLSKGLDSKIAKLLDRHLMPTGKQSAVRLRRRPSTPGPPEADGPEWVESPIFVRP